MRPYNSCRAFLAASTLALGGCSDTTTDPSPVSVDVEPPSGTATAPAGGRPMLIEGFPVTQQIRTGENVLLTLKNVPSEVESLRWRSDTPGVASVTSTPAVSPCGSACAWLRGEAAGSARIEVIACYVDGGCRSVTRARVAGGEVETALSVMP